MERVKCAECDGFVLKDFEHVCWNCTDPSKKKKENKSSLGSKITKPKKPRKPKYIPPTKSLLRHLSGQTAASLKEYTKEWFDSATGVPPGTTTKRQYTEMWAEMDRVFMLCTACKWANDHVCSLACWEGESR